MSWCAAQWLAQPAILVGKPFALDIAVCPATAELLRVDATMPEHRHGMNCRPSLTPLGVGRCRAEGLLWPAWSPAQTLPPFTAEERAQIAAHGPWPVAVEPDRSNRVERNLAAVTWGRQLFHDRSLSADGRVSCASCHVPSRAFQDSRAAPLLRDDKPAAARNTPSLLDVACQRWLGWDGAHDNLWSASRALLLKAAEMGWRVPALAARARAGTRLSAGYRRVFGTPWPADDERLGVDLAKALAAYQATLQSPRTPFDRFRDALLRGDTRRAAAYPAQAQRGLKLFIGRGRCSVRHVGPRFSNGEFADIGVPFNDAAVADPRAVHTRHLVLEPRHFGEFRVPGRRQLTRTAHYMHNGSLASIEDVVRHCAELNEDRSHADGERILRRLDLTPEESADLAAFLRNLSGR